MSDIEIPHAARKKALDVIVYWNGVPAPKSCAEDVLNAAGPPLIAHHLRRISWNFPPGSRLALRDMADELDPPKAERNAEWEQRAHEAAQRFNSHEVER